MSSPIGLSIGFNFDDRLIEGLRALNTKAGRVAVKEVFAALPDGPVPSARPESRIRAPGWKEFAGQVDLLRGAGIGFNYLLNARIKWTPAVRAATRDFVARLSDAGVSAVTVAHEEMIDDVKAVAPALTVVVSVTRGVSSEDDIRRIAASGADATYLDPTVVNRDFGSLRRLIAASRLPVRLYANVSCLSRCPVTARHYALFGIQRKSASVAAANDQYFLGCSLVKVLSPVEWIQMPWIRPEDLPVYAALGVTQFKLSDRLASTAVILRIAAAYCALRSPADLFEMIERDGGKFRLLGFSTPPMRIHSSRVPADFIEHFTSGSCCSDDVGCEYCTGVARNAVEQLISAAELRELANTRMGQAPAKLLRRANESDGPANLSDSVTCAGRMDMASVIVATARLRLSDLRSEGPFG